MAEILFADLETFSEADLKKVGSYRYAEDPTTEILLFPYAIDDGPAKVYDATTGERPPRELMRALRKCATGGMKLVGQNFLMFDRKVLDNCWGIDIPVEHIHDTMIAAYRQALPGNLDMLCKVLGLENQKNDKGKALINRFCKPAPKNHKAQRYTRKTHPELWDDFIEYARDDITSMRDAYYATPQWNNSEMENLILAIDQRINDRGFFVDMELALAAITADAEHKAKIKSECQSVFGCSPTGAQFLPALRRLAPAFSIPNAQKSTMRDLLKDKDFPDIGKKLIKMRMEASSKAATKYTPLVNGSSSDGRRRGTVQYGGAKRTLRWAGRGFQPQNLAQGFFKTEGDDEEGTRKLIAKFSRALKAMRTGIGLDLFNVHKLTVSGVRPCIIPAPGKKFCVADYSNVEGRGLAWAAGETTALDTFIKGLDIYKVTAGKMFGMSPEQIDKALRQIGKACELGLGYGGGVSAFLQFAKVLGLDLVAMAETMDGTFPDHIWNAAIKGYEFARIQEKNKRAGPGEDKPNRPSYDLPKKVWLTCDSIKRLWRESHPRTVKLWNELESAAMQAIKNPGKSFWAGANVRPDGTKAFRVVRTRKNGGPGWWLKIELPSGRFLCYPGIGLTAEKDAVGGKVRSKISYMGENQKTRRWEKQFSYGGKLTENCISGDALILQEGLGLIALKDARQGLRVWDGEEFVEFSHLKYSGNQKVISKYGITLTPDHKILTNEGWKDASSCAQSDRRKVRLPDGYSLGRFGWQKVNMGISLCMRGAETDARYRGGETAQARGANFLRMQTERVNSLQKNFAWYVRTSVVRSMAGNESQMLKPEPFGIQKLRGARAYRLPTLARFLRKLRGGYVADLSEGLRPESEKQQSGLFTGELQVAYAEEKFEQQKDDSKRRMPPRQYTGLGVCSALRAKIHNRIVSFRSRVGVARNIGTCDVYDLVNCGPRNQFVVFGSEGPVIVHNCIQALCRDVLAWSMPGVEHAGYEIVLSVHDELITEVPDTDDYSSDELCELMCDLPDWAIGFPLKAEGTEMMFYRK